MSCIIFLVIRQFVIVDITILHLPLVNVQEPYQFEKKNGQTYFKHVLDRDVIFTQLALSINRRL